MRPGPITYESESKNHHKNNTSHTCSAAYTAFEHLGQIGVPPNIRFLVSFLTLLLWLRLRNADGGDRIAHIADPEIFELQIISAKPLLSSLCLQLYFSSLFHDIIFQKCLTMKPITKPLSRCVNLLNHAFRTKSIRILMIDSTN